MRINRKVKIDGKWVMSASAQPAMIGKCKLSSLLIACCVPLALNPIFAQEKQAGATQAQMVSIGSYRLFLNCTGKPNGPTVILISSLTADNWKKVQLQVASFAQVCSYDREGVGKSDIHIPVKQTVQEIVTDLHTLLEHAGVRPPYILVGHSIAGIYARRFTELYQEEAAGLVLVDSAHEEQVWRFEKISHSLLFEYRDWPNYSRLSGDGFLPPGSLLKWRDDVPLVVLEHGIPWARGYFKGMTESQYLETNATWDMLQHDLASRSTCADFKIAEKSGHFIHFEQPEIVVEAVQEVLGMSCGPRSHTDESGNLQSEP